MTQLTQDVEAELEEFQNKITPMAEKMKDLQKLNWLCRCLKLYTCIS